LILSKFAEKVRCARQQLQKPAVVEGELEPDSSLWCYFCELEVMRHVTDRLTTVVWGGLLEHMASPPHHKKTRGYWWVNGADKKLLQNFLLFEAEYRRYKELVAEALQQLESKRELKLKEEVRQLQAQEESQQLAAREVCHATLCGAALLNSHRSIRACLRLSTLPSGTITEYYRTPLDGMKVEECGEEE
jgi:hypothetical protein